MITIELPKALGLNVDGKSEVVIDEPCATVGDALAALGRKAPGVLDRVVDEQGEIRMHINVFKDGESIRFLDGVRTPVQDRTSILILAAISGG